MSLLKFSLLRSRHYLYAIILKSNSQSWATLQINLSQLEHFCVRWKNKQFIISHKFSSQIHILWRFILLIHHECLKVLNHVYQPTEKKRWMLCFKNFCVLLSPKNNQKRNPMTLCPHRIATNYATVIYVYITHTQIKPCRTEASLRDSFFMKFCKRKLMKKNPKIPKRRIHFN